MPPTQATHFEVGQKEQGLRLDRLLGERLGLSRTQVKRLLAEGAVTVDGKGVGRAGKGDPLTRGQRVAVLPFLHPEHQQPIPLDNPSVRELACGTSPSLASPSGTSPSDASPSGGWVIVDKPAGMPVHPLHADETHTALNTLVARHPAILGVGEGALRSGVVHRLDIGTSGTLLFALDPNTWQRFRDAFREHRTTKTYLAIVQGQLHVGDSITLPLEVAQHRPAKVRVTGGEGRMCSLTYRPLEIFDHATLLEVALHTGFLHQIRVTLAYLGHPILNDTHYAPPGTIDEAPHVNAGPPTPGSFPESTPCRPMLHAHFLRCEEAQATADPPDDFRQTLQHLRQGR